MNKIIIVVMVTLVYVHAAIRIGQDHDFYVTMPRFQKKIGTIIPLNPLPDDIF